ncbi:hypothetical protein C1646_719676 [Rhizophagus diaphanus]|nr:hypothetical protein C1646_719676 [Rhizophagus diaphanus] [Rhizophagus sp. MUCL 43196]
MTQIPISFFYFNLGAASKKRNNLFNFDFRLGILYITIRLFFFFFLGVSQDVAVYLFLLSSSLLLFFD